MYRKTVAFPVYVSFCCLLHICFFQSETPTYEKNAEYNSSAQIQTSKKNTGRILIISAGSVISLALMLIILHELVTHQQIHAQNDVHQVVNDVYDDIDAVERVS